MNPYLVVFSLLRRHRSGPVKEMFLVGEVMHCHVHGVQGTEHRVEIEVISK